MKDSRVGAYALIGVVLLMALKISVLIEINAAKIPLLLIAAGSLSRWSTLIISRIWPYARPTGESKSRESTSRLSVFRFVAAFVPGIAPLFWFPEWCIFWSVPLVIVSSLLAGRWFHQRLGGYAGDSLGAVQQVNEVLILMVALIIDKI
jgi:adenosylcobinamide-GDP ribazoletransferase